MLGYFAVILIILGYYLITIEKIKPTSIYYQSIQLIGSYIIYWDCINKDAYAAAFLNAFVIVIAAQTIGKKLYK